MDGKDHLRPTEKARVIDLVRAAGIDVTAWAISRSGVMKVPASNPAFCYEWSFTEPGSLVVVNIWYSEIIENAGAIFINLDLRGWAESQKWEKLTPAQRSSRTRRALKMDEALRHAFDRSLEVRVIVGDGARRDVSASSMTFRRLDPAPWHVSKYDCRNGKCTLTRAKVAQFVDQFSIEDSERPIARVSLVKSYTRNSALRWLALSRAAGICEYCGLLGFETISGAIYLETHHIVPLSEGGLDSEHNLAAICANDHRAAHHGTQQQSIRKFLQQRRNYDTALVH